jgi:endonuclease YncB( thermonuclease family)
MAKGLLRVHGTIRLGQFWPNGKSDADTTKVLVKVGPAGFEFRPGPGLPFQPTGVFAHALVKGKGQAPKPPLNSKGEVTIRLQGIDAPELHYRPSPLKGKGITPQMRADFKTVNKEYRQRWSESAALALGKFLATEGVDPLPCVVETAVDEPNDPFDVYARLVGDIIVTVKGKRVNLNNWLLENGYASPSFYVSMSKAEIAAKLKAAAKGSTTPPAQAVTGKIGTFNFKLVYRGKKDLAAPPQIGQDQGPVLLPKLYRRQTSWACRKKANALAAATFLAHLKQSPDKFHLRADFLAQGKKAPATTLDAHLKSGVFQLKAQDMVLLEKESELIDATTKQPITAWFVAAGGIL